MATIRKKLCVEAVSRWQRSVNFFVIMISVTHEDGSPVTSLTKSNFKAGRFQQSWHSFNIGDVDAEANNRGFYSFIHAVTASEQFIIQDFFLSNRDLTVEVTKEINKGGNDTIFHGQCIVAMESTEVLEMA